MAKKDDNDSQNAINLDSLSLEQLSNLKTQEEQRLQMNTQRYAQLRAVAAKLSAARTALNEIPARGSEGREILVPLTPSLYAPGKIRDPNKVMVELGTGFYVEKTNKDAVSFLERKLKLVDANSQNIMKLVQSLNYNLESITMAMQGKMLEIRARQEGMRYQASQEKA